VRGEECSEVGFTGWSSLSPPPAGDLEAAEIDRIWRAQVEMEVELRRRGHEGGSIKKRIN
jgi:hypothetical protein